MLKRTKIAALMLIVTALLMTMLEARADLYGSQSHRDTTAVQGVRTINLQLGMHDADPFGLQGSLPGAKRFAQGYGRRKGGYQRNPYPANRPGRYRELPPAYERAPNRPNGLRRDRFVDDPPARRNPYRSIGPNRPGQFQNSISPSRAINLARSHVDGKLLGIRRAKRYGMTVYVVKFRTASRVREVIVDASSGSVLN